MSIKRIAQLAGVSPATVSRVLNNPEYHCSSEEMRTAILRAARQLNYVPNEAARNLKKGIKTQTKLRYLGILVTRGREADIDPFFRELLRLLEGEIHRNCCLLSKIWYRPQFSLEISTAAEREAEQMFAHQQRLDGLIIVGKCSQPGLRALKKQCRYLVSVNRNSTNYEIDEVLCDGKKIAATAVEHLIHLGHRRICYVGECQGEARFLGFQRTLEKYDIPVYAEYMIPAQAKEEDGFHIMEQLSRQPFAPTAIYCAHDIIAVGMLKYLAQYKRNYYRPSIISSDDIAEAQETTPMLTTVHLPKEEMVRYALFLLLDHMNGGHKSVTRIKLEAQLMRRESCRDVSETEECEYYI